MMGCGKLFFLNEFMYHLTNNINKIIDALDYRNNLVWFMVFNATFNNISVISWWSVLLVEDLSQIAEKLYHIMLY